MGSTTASRISIVSFAAAMVGTTTRAEALSTVGVDAGIAQRVVDYTEHLHTAFAFGAHAEFEISPEFRLGPYYLHYELPSDSNQVGPAGGAPWFGGGVHNVLGVRARFVVPIPGKLEPYFFVGVGNTWLSYRFAVGRFSGRFVELPIGVGISYAATPNVFIALDAAYRPAVLFTGDAFDDDGYHPSTGTSFLLSAGYGW